MNRTFHARIAWYHYFGLALLTVNAVGALWCKYVVASLLFMLMLVVLIELIIHTAYTVTPEGRLVISRGRFLRRRTVDLKDIRSVERCRSMRFGNFSMTDYLLIEYGKEQYVALMPRKEEEFLKCIGAFRK